LAFAAAAQERQDPPKIAVYVTGNVPDDEKKALGTRMLATLINSGRYKGIERSNSFLAEIEKEQTKQRSGAIDDNQISELGRQFGVKFVCIADITPAFGEFQVSARIIDVETAEVVFIGESFSALKSSADLVTVSNQVVKSMFGEQTANMPTMAYSVNVTVSPAYELPYMSRAMLNIGVSVKYPFAIPAGKAMNVYPIAGIDYDFPLSAKLEFTAEGAEDYVFDGGNKDGYNADILSAV